MATNPTPTNDAELLAVCHDLTRGCEALEAEIGLKQNTAATMQAVLDAARAALFEVGQCKTERGLKRAELRKRDREGEQVLGRCRLRLAAIFGNGFNVNWEAAGFTDRSTMVPEVFAKRLGTLSRLSGYFTATPAHESQDMQATAAICEATHEALSHARSAVNRHKSVLRTAVVNKNAALKKLRQRMRGLILELDILLAADDPRWQRFGLNRPASETMPQPVKQVTLSALGNGNVQVEWPPAPHATRYRVQMRVMGTNEFSAVATVHGTEAMLKELPPGEFIEVRVIAANAMDEAAPSPASVVVVR